MSQGLIDAVTDSVQTANESESSTFDVDASVFDGFEARLENLHWRETDEGVLLVGNSQVEPDTLVSIEMVSDGLEVNEIDDPETVNWRRANVVSQPNSASTPQFD